MSIGSKRELYSVVKLRYQYASRDQKSRILDEYSANAGISRKYAIRLLNEGYRKGKKKPGRKSIYSNDREFCEALRIVWKLFNYSSGKILTPQIPELLKHYELHYPALSVETKNKFLKVSSATVDRILRKYKSRGKVTTKPGSLLRTEIPIQGNVWEESKPGFLEADTVAHCGMTTQGIYINTVTLTDIATQWTECRAMFGKGAHETLLAINEMKSSFPFEMKGFDSDNGSEFINQHLVRYMAERNIKFTRSRPYKKNDNAHVEQKNYSFVRQLMGYARLENPDLVPVMNEVYVNWCRLKNFFIPNMKLIEKRRVGSKIYKVHDKPITSYQRVLNSSHVSDEKKLQLQRFYESLDPFQLKKNMDALTKQIPALARISFNDWKLLQLPQSH